MKIEPTVYELPPEGMIIDETVPVDDPGSEYITRKNSRTVRYTPISRKEKP